MQASFKTHNDGTVALHLDTEAAHAVFASVIFAARFNQRFEPLAEMAERCLHEKQGAKPRSNNLCQ